MISQPEVVVQETKLSTHRTCLFHTGPRDDHAVAMVRFAHDCLTKMNEVTQTLELELGPGTGDLTMRFGLHSGPVTAGVLRGEKTRFQL